MIRTSVAMCTYNGEQYIVEQLNSILQQESLPDEIVICDDGSTDSTLNLIEKFSTDNSLQIRLYKNVKQLGVLKNFEKALLLCKGEIIFLCDQDDVWLRNKTSWIINYFDNHKDKDLIFSNAYIKRNEHKTRENLWDIINFRGDIIEAANNNIGMLRRFVIKQNIATGATMAVRKEFLRQVLPFVENVPFMHDHILAIYAAAKSSLGRIDESLMYYRLHEKQTVGIDKNKDLDNVLRKARKKNWMSNMVTVTIMLNLINDVLKKVGIISPEENVIFLKKVLAHYQRRSFIINSKPLFALIFGVRELFKKEGYSFSNENTKMQIKTFLKDTITH